MVGDIANLTPGYQNRFAVKLARVLALGEPPTVYDVIVVGAGPAGSTAATILAKNNLQTLLIDRENFPRDKACGDAVGVKGMRILHEMGIGPFDSTDFFTVKNVFMKGPYGAHITVKLNETQEIGSMVVSRYVFDQMLLDHAVKSGAEYCNLNVTAPIIEEGQVVGVRAKSDQKMDRSTSKSEIDYRAKVVIAADGATSVIGRAVSGYQRPDRHRAIALRGYIETDVDLNGTIELNFLRTMQPGYAWFFPTGKRRANIGVGMRADTYKNYPKTLNDALQDYVSSPELRARVGMNRIHSIKSWQLPIYAAEGQQRVFNGALLVGDAGGFVDPMTGAGIYPAIVTGKCAAETVVEAIQMGNVTAQGLASYDAKWQSALLSDMKRAQLFYRLSSLVPSLIDGFLLTVRAVPQLQSILLGKV